ncbi:MAG: hypothetical protein JW864_06400 [Spirochaetes bacterium]|nr:hypothetical protein [Spirochaetota bacterium]
MEFTYENLLEWFEGYFNDVKIKQGDLESVSYLKKYFSEDFELLMYTSRTSPPAKTMSRDALLMSFVHPGLQEEIDPKHYVIDIKQKIVAVQFEIRFFDKSSGKEWNPIQASAHYHLIFEGNKGIKIKKIQYWTENLPEDVFEYWAKYREEALSKHAINYINTRPG